MAISPAREPELLAAARDGDETAFGSLVAPYRGELHAHCYRMLGSVQDAEDALQETLLRAWRALARFEGRSSLRSWLYTIATNTSLNAISRRPKQRVLPMDYGPSFGADDIPGQPVIESVWVEPYPDDQLGYEQRESVELAFVAALQHLPPNQRAVLILREVLDFSAKEVAEALETTTASVNSALQRARATVDERLPEQSQQATLRALDDRELRELVEKYMAAMQAGDVEAVVGMLAEDAVWSMPPLASWYRGHTAIRGFLRNGPLSGFFQWRHLHAHANGQLASAAYTWHPEDETFRPFAVDVFTFEGTTIKEITSFIARDPDIEDEKIARWPDSRPDRVEIFERFGLPDRLD
jgi:RNA polymerase sigma-70 factor (ECF subfamily)